MMKKPKLIPPVMTLAAAAVTCAFCLILKVSFSLFVKRLAVVTVVFLILGFIVRLIVEWNFPPEVPVEEAPEETEEGQKAELSAEDEE